MYNSVGTAALWTDQFVKACLHRRFLLWQLDAIFLTLKLQLQNRMCKPHAIFSAICRRDIAGVLNMFETWCNFAATKIASSCRDKKRLCKRGLTGMVVKIEQFSIECRKVIGFVLTTLNDWLKKLAPLRHPIRSKTITGRDALALVFTRFASATRDYFEFWLVYCIVCVHCDWLQW